jgi:SAM-dependent methyltransferase
MQAYNQGFAKVYNLRWTAFARTVAPHILSFYGGTPLGQDHHAVLDLCCGTGQLAVHFLEHDYRVVGLDLSEPMLSHARQNSLPYLTAGQAHFVQGDASQFTLDERFGLVVSTFDALNHLKDLAALRSCFGCVQAVCDGYFIFDLNTRFGLKRWNSINIDDNDEIMIVNRGIYTEETGKAWARITGFVRQENGLFERFEETAYNTAFSMTDVKTTLLETGWKNIHFARIDALCTPLQEPELESRVFIVASQ